MYIHVYIHTYTYIYTVTSPSLSLTFFSSLSHSIFKVCGPSVHHTYIHVYICIYMYTYIHIHTYCDISTDLICSHMLQTEKYEFVNLLHVGS